METRLRYNKKFLFIYAFSILAENAYTLENTQKMQKHVALADNQHGIASKEFLILLSFYIFIF